MKKLLTIGLVLTLATVSSLVAESTVDLEAYAECTSFALAEEPPPPEAREVCLGPAGEGLPGAQYALGAILLSLQEYPEAIQWLERAAATQHPPAAHLLGELYLQSGREDSEARGRALLQFAICAGYPPALSSQSRIGLGDTPCDTGRPAFDGSWSASLEWVTSPPGGGAEPARLRVVVSDQSAQVFMQSGEAWQEVKAGAFQTEQVDDTLVVRTVDSGWDLDGKWIESWTLQLMRTSPDEAEAVLLRTVNNIYVPEATGLRTFVTVAQGQASRESLPEPDEDDR